MIGGWMACGGEPLASSGDQGDRCRRYLGGAQFAGLNSRTTIAARAA
jgi:hypothetical protein